MSTNFKKSTACVNKTLVLFWNFFRKTFLKIFLRTFASKAEMGSSIRIKLLSAYTALARLTLAF